MNEDDREGCEDYIVAAARLQRLNVPAVYLPAVVANFCGLRDVFRLLEGWRQAIGSEVADTSGKP